MVRSYGSETLTLTKGDSANIIISADTDFATKSGTPVQLTKAVDGSALTTAVVISDATKAVTTFNGGSGKDTIYAFDQADGVVTNITGGKGTDRFVLTTDNADGGKVAQYVITDYEAGDIIDFGGTAFAGMVDYDKRAYISGENIILSDTDVEVTVTGGKGKAISFGTAAADKVTFSDPVNVTLAGTSTLLSWTADSTAVDTDRIKTFNASKNSKGAVTFEATGTEFTSFIGNKKGTTLTIGSDVTTAVAIDPGTGDNTITLSTKANGNPVETISYTGGKLTLTNFGTEDKFLLTGSIKESNITGATVHSDTTVANNNVKFTIKGAEVNITGAGVTFSLTDWDNGTAKESGKTEDSDTFVYSYVKSVKVDGITYAYGISTLESKKEEWDANAHTRSAFEERYTADDIISYGDTVYSGQEGDSPFAEITTTKVAVDVNSTSDAEVNELIKGVSVAFSGVSKERQDK